MWEPQDGFQVDALEARYVVDELFGGGNRGGGKSDWLLEDFASDVEKWGSAWKGILFRKTFSQFRELIDRSKELFHVQFPGSEFKEGSLTWHFPNGSRLQMFHMAEDSDAEKHLGISYPWIGYDELPHWPNAGPYKRLKACNRSAVKGLPRRIRSTGNPGGAGLAWIKDYFQIPNDPSHPGGELIKILDPETKTTRTRMFLRSSMFENKIFLEANPDYPATVREACEGNEQLELAWLQGNFNVFFGKFFTSFDPEIHSIEPSELFNNGTVPEDWRVYGALDYGESDYTWFGLFLVGNHPETNQEISYLAGEYYRRGLWPSEYAGQIRDMVHNHPVTRGRNPERVFADTSIWYTRAEAGGNPMDRMVSDIFRNQADLRLEMANKNRISGWRFLKECLAWKRNATGDLIKYPKLYYSPDCHHFERTMSHAVYAGDEDNPKEDINTRQEEHPCDGTRYFVMGAIAPRKFQKEDKSKYLTMGDIKRRIMNPNLRKEAYYVPVPENDNIDLLINEMVD